MLDRMYLFRSNTAFFARNLFKGSLDLGQVKGYSFDNRAMAEYGFHLGNLMLVPGDENKIQHG